LFADTGLPTKIEQKFPLSNPETAVQSVLLFFFDLLAGRQWPDVRTITNLLSGRFFFSIFVSKKNVSAGGFVEKSSLFLFKQTRKSLA